MAPRIENRLEHKILLFDIEKQIGKLLKVIPKEHLLGLDCIVIVDEIRGKFGKRPAGTYRRKQGREPAYIEISARHTFGDLPKVLFMIPLIPKLLLAGTLFHEIGHHYQYTFKSRIGKKGWEPFAEKYRKQMFPKLFPVWLFFLRPFNPLIQFMNKRQEMNNKEA